MLLSSGVLVFFLGKCISMKDDGGNFFDIPSKIEENDLLLEYGKYMLENMNRSVNPCEDFYQYACGNWQRGELVPQKGRKVSFLETIQIKVNDGVKTFLNNSNSASNSSAEMKARNLYTSCIRANNDIGTAYKKLTQSFEETFSNGATMDWMKVNFLSQYGIYPLVPLQFVYNFRGLKYELEISGPRPVLGFFDFDKFAEHVKLTEEEMKDLTKDFDEMKEFERNLTAFNVERSQTETVSLGRFLLIHKLDTLDWKYFFDVAFNGTAKTSWTIHNRIGNVNGLERFLRKANTNLLLRYVQWRTIARFYEIWRIHATSASIEGTCLFHTRQYFAYAVVPWLIETTFGINHRADILNISSQLKETFYSFIDKYAWLDESTKSGAKTKLRAMEIVVAYTDDLTHRIVLDRAYENYNITAIDFWENIMELERGRVKLVRSKLLDMVLLSWIILPQSVNGLYFSFHNVAYITLSLAQFPLYHLNFPESLKFGGIATLIGHEMAHGFDSFNHQFDYDGMIRNWWSEGSFRNFQERYRCLETQYNMFVFKGIRTDGVRTLGDNIADVTGTRIAYHAFVKTISETDAMQKPIPGLDFNNKQLFFLKFAQMWCEGRDLDVVSSILKTDVHAYEKFRVAGTVMNMPEFSEVFHCPLGTTMNPLKKCVVW